MNNDIAAHSSCDKFRILVVDLFDQNVLNTALKPGADIGLLPEGG